MVNHRRNPENSDDTAVDDAEYQRDVADLLAASTRLREIGEQVDDAQKAAITLAVDHAVKEAARVADARSNRRRGQRVGGVAPVLVDRLLQSAAGSAGIDRAASRRRRVR